MLIDLVTKDRKAQQTLDAISRSQGIIEFNLDGSIRGANSNFLALMGYSSAEVVGRHHSMFCDPEFAASAEYHEFWAKLARGEYQVAQFKRLAKGGREVWVEASYNPVLDASGKPYKVVKITTDVTASKLAAAELRGQVDAIRKSQAVIEFNLDGIVIDANANFLSVIGYGLDEIKGRHHSMFVDSAFAQSAEYREFWAKLKRGEFESAQYKRIAKGGRPVWIEASYNPIFDLNGKPYKVIKFATDVTKQVELLAELKRLIDHNFGEIESAVQQSSARSTNAGSAAGQTSANVQTVAASVEELAASIQEISQSMAKSQSAADGAFNQAVEADQATARLTEAAKSMGGIVDLIHSIASQINMLALNATIESARAGEAGKGFAVVATEVKHLAKQVADATGQISREIEGVQSVAVDVAHALSAIRASIETLREFVASTAGAVEEQSAVTRDMSSNMQSASKAVDEISRNIGDIVAAIGQVSSSVIKTKDAATVLAR